MKTNNKVERLKELKLLVWEKGNIIPQCDPDVWRHDNFASVLKYSEYGNHESVYGWEMNRIKSDAGDGIENLRPIYWKHAPQRNKEIEMTQDNSPLGKIAGVPFKERSAALSKEKEECEKWAQEMDVLVTALADLIKEVQTMKSRILEHQKALLLIFEDE